MFRCSVNAVTRVVNNTLRVYILLRVSTLSALHYTKLYDPHYELLALRKTGITQTVCVTWVVCVTRLVTRVVRTQ